MFNVKSRDAQLQERLSQIETTNQLHAMSAKFRSNVLLDFLKVSHCRYVKAVRDFYGFCLFDKFNPETEIT